MFHHKIQRLPFPFNFLFSYEEISQAKQMHIKIELIKGNGGLFKKNLLSTQEVKDFLPQGYQPSKCSLG